MNNLVHKLVLMTDILQSNACLAYKLNSVFCVFLTTATILYFTTLPWGKFLLAPRSWGFTWPAAIRVLSRSERANPGNEVNILISFLNEPFARDVILLMLPESIRWKKKTTWIALSFWSGRSPKFSITQSCFLSSNWFFECEHSFIEKPMIMWEATVTSARLLGLGLKLYPGNMQRMFNKDFTRFTQSFSSTQKSTKWKKASAGMVPVTHLKRFFSVQPVEIHPVMP